ncbi:hypothetical protein QJS10_CPB13g00920 [Acorus calamus]|uniref:CCHC-type domain-containing protein n=1 Tax=Acorus calamus TaxID=4465 RepID=A0AAV9DEH3_ACOCL|nr:hypothetical protein QJS10_CPB13g00920 [Acorus calamus]
MVNGTWQTVRAMRGGRSERQRIPGDRAVAGGKRRRGEETSGATTCFRCLGKGHRAWECREPPRCWSCNKLGHRRSVCRGGHIGNHPPPQVQPVPQRHGEVISLSWSSGLSERATYLGQSVMVSWEGLGEDCITDILEALKGKWRGIDFDQYWRLSVGCLLIRLPSMAARNLVLSQGSVLVGGEQVFLRECLFTSGACSPEGDLSTVFLKGIPLLWHTRDVIRRVVEPIGMFANFDEVETSLDPFPLVRARIWRRKGATLPSFIAVELGGWEVKIEVLMDEYGRKPSFAEVVAGTSGSLRWERVTDKEVVHETDGGPPKPPPPREDLFHHGGCSDPSRRRRRRRRRPRKKRARREVRQKAPEAPDIEEEGTRGKRREGSLHDNQGIAIGVPGTLEAPRVVRMPGGGTTSSTFSGTNDSAWPPPLRRSPGLAEE